MKRAVLAATLVAISTAAFADNALVRKEIPAAAAKPAVQQTSKAVRLSDAELDKITAAGATVVLTGGGVTAILNPGHQVKLEFLKKNLLCINCPL